MIAPNFERQWQHPEPDDRQRSAEPALPSIHHSILADMENHIWIETPEASAETLQPSPAPLEPQFADSAIEARKHRDGLRRTELLGELRQLAEPPEPPIENNDDDGRDPEERPGDTGLMESGPSSPARSAAARYATAPAGVGCCLPAATAAGWGRSLHVTDPCP